MDGGKATRLVEVTKEVSVGREEAGDQGTPTLKGQVSEKESAKETGKHEPSEVGGQEGAVS